MKNRNQKRLRKVLGPVMLAIFSVGFLFGAYKIAAILCEDRQSETAYAELREQMTEKTSPAPVVSDRNDDVEDRYTDQTVAVLCEDGHSETVYAELREQMTEEASPAPAVSDRNDDVENKYTETSVTERYTAKRRQSMNMKSLLAAYPDMRAWIVAEGTGIDYPIMQAADNEYYLSHLYDGTSNSNGSIFMDYRNTGMFTDDNTVIYGHHMKNGTMFRVLTEYKAQEFYEAHPTMTIYTEDGDYLIELICGTIENGNTEFIEFNFEDFDDMNRYVDELKKRSTFESEVALCPGDKLVSLCTCTYERENARYMLLGKATELYE